MFDVHDFKRKKFEFDQKLNQLKSKFKEEAIRMNKMFRDQANDFKKRIDSMLELNEGWIKKMFEY